MKAHRWLRDTHLLLGLFACATVLMYGVSSVQMVHRDWLPWRPTLVEQTVTLDQGLSDGRILARALMSQHGLWGDLTEAAPTPDGLRVRIQRPGTGVEAVYAAASGETRLKINRAPFAGMIVALHHARGVTHESTAANLWGVLVGVVSVGLVVLGATGVYLWFKIHNERAIGGVILAVSLVFSLGLVTVIRAAG